VADLLALEGEIGSEAKLAAESVRRFLADHVDAHIAEWFEAGTLPRELATQFGSLGILGMPIDGYGCAGASPVTYGAVCRELEAVDSGLRSFVSAHGSLAMSAIWLHGSEEQKREWLPGMARGELIGCFGLTEPDAGSDPKSMRTAARRKGSDWVLHGTKLWITNGGLSDVAVVWAAAADGIRGFLVPRDTPGLSISNIHGKLSMRASVTSELALDDCHLPADAALPGALGLKAPFSCLNEARFGIVWGVVGAARSCAQTALDYAGSRIQFGRPISSFQLVQRKLVEMELELTKASLVAHRLAMLKAAGALTPVQLSLGKLNNVRSALEIARTARTVLGANGISAEYPVLRHACNLESVLTYEGTEEIHTLILGRELTGEIAFA
jgi:glutaryl-CoA dehydrogenase